MSEPVTELPTIQMTAEDVADLNRLRTEESIRKAEMLGQLEVAGERVDPSSPWATVERIQRLRLALRGLGRVGNHVNREGKAVGQQIQIVLGPHEAESLMMQLTGRVHLETVPES